MKMMKQSSLMNILLLFSLFSFGQVSDSPMIHEQWKASWIKVPGESDYEYGVYLFRKSINLDSVPARFDIHVSADNRYKLYVNQKLVSLGPARGDLEHWNFETVDIAQYLQPGQNVISARVWNEAAFRPEAQISLQTGFILQGNVGNLSLNTDKSWKCTRDSSYGPIPFSGPFYYVSGAGEFIDMRHHITDFSSVNFNDESWKSAQPIFHGIPKDVRGGYGTANGWMLVPSIIPAMEMSPQRFRAVRESSGVKLPESFPVQSTDIHIPANTNVSVLLDQGELTNAYPTMRFSNGVGSSITLRYTEALYTKFPDKGNRNEVAGKQFLGRMDSIISNGKANQVFESLNWRTFRYIKLDIKTGSEPLVLNDISSCFTGYPFQFNAKLETALPEIKTILDIGWRTARLCAVETYMDCPYYEQLQYIGDGRIQALISLYNSGDDRLVRNALNLMDHSRQPEGVTLSRHPSFTPQIIPTFSLWYIGMLHDYWMYAKDTSFVIKKIPGTRQVLQYFNNYQASDGSIQNVPNWMFTDWVNAPEWKSGVAPRGKDGSSSILDLTLLWAYQLAAEMEGRNGMRSFKDRYLAEAAKLKKTIRSKYWDQSRGLFSDRPEKDLFSQHANSLAILTGLTNKAETNSIAEKLLRDTTMAAASIYFRYYLHQALIKAGRGNEYLSWLDKWRENISSGLSTWAEMSDVSKSRSDCHAWGSSPNIEFFRTILGIDSDAPGFNTVRIQPHLGSLNNIQGSIPHPNGELSTQYIYQEGQWNIQIKLPSATKGKLIWKGKQIPLNSGLNKFTLQ